ncbi:MAG: class I SAM-dependent methyltransferase [Geminicoccaceae bacterium]
MTTSLVAFCLIAVAGMLATGALIFWIMTHVPRREGLYDLLYSLRWGEATTNNYGFAPAETGDPEGFQLQLYAELLKLLGTPAPGAGVERVVEISCGRGGGLRHVALRLPGAKQVVGLDFSMHAVRYCRTRYAALRNVAFVRGHALQLPFADGSVDLVINVEASHAYGDDPAFLREVKRVLRTEGRLLYADYRTRRKVPRLEQRIRSAGLAGTLRDITPNVVRACELDSPRRQALIRSGLPWWCRPFVVGRLEQYAGIPGTVAYERLRNRDRMYFIACLTVAQGALGEAADRFADRAA